MSTVVRKSSQTVNCISSYTTHIVIMNELNFWQIRCVHILFMQNESAWIICFSLKIRFSILQLFEDLVDNQYWKHRFPMLKFFKKYKEFKKSLCCKIRRRINIWENLCIGRNTHYWILIWWDRFKLFARCLLLAIYISILTKGLWLLACCLIGLLSFQHWKGVSTKNTFWFYFLTSRKWR